MPATLHGNRFLDAGGSLGPPLPPADGARRVPGAPLAATVN